VASLYTLHTGTLSLLRKPLLSSSLLAGLQPYWEIMQQQGKLPGPLAKFSIPAASSPLSDWLHWLPESYELFRASSALGAKDQWWQLEMQKRVHCTLQFVRNYTPWLDPRFAQLREDKELGI